MSRMVCTYCDEPFDYPNGFPHTSYSVCRECWPEWVQQKSDLKMSTTIILLACAVFAFIGVVVTVFSLTK